MPCWRDRSRLSWSGLCKLCASRSDSWTLLSAVSLRSLYATRATPKRLPVDHIRPAVATASGEVDTPPAARRQTTDSPIGTQCPSGPSCRPSQAFPDKCPGERYSGDRGVIGQAVDSVGTQSTFRSVVVAERLGAIFVWVAWMVFSLARSKIIQFRRAEREAGSQPRNAGIDNGRNS